MQQSPWYTLDKAYPLLNRPSRQALYKWAMSQQAIGRLKLGKHIRVLNPSARRVTWEINIQEINLLK
jgi:hypothetical protein